MTNDEVHDKEILDVFLKIDEAENDIANGKLQDANSSIKNLRQKYDL